MTTRYGFTGRERDDFTGLMHYRARHYDPKLGRFISEDPIGFAGGDANLYGYVLNNPLQFRDPYGLDPWSFGDNPYDLIPESGWTAIAYAGNFAAGFGDTVTLGGTNYIREAMGTNGVVYACSNAYFAGDITGTIIPLLMGGAGVAKGALAMGGRSGNLATRLGRGSQRFVYDNRTWGSVRRQYWSPSTGYGPATPNHLHHWMFPQRATQIPQGIRNAGFNQMVLPGSLNSWMGGGSNAARAVEWGIRAAVPASIAGGAGARSYWGVQKESWKSDCACN